MRKANKCSVDGCALKYEAKGYCKKHYQYYRRHGIPVFVPPSKQDIILKKSMPITESGCWIWEGALDKSGYGLANRRSAHRVSHEAFKGEIPNGMLVLHKCDNPSCVNPEHLFLGTQRDNVHDAIRKGRFKPHVNGGIRYNLSPGGPYCRKMNHRNSSCEGCQTKREHAELKSLLWEWERSRG